MIEYSYTVVAFLGIIAAWDAIRRYIEHCERMANKEATSDLDEVKTDLADTKARLADVITAINLNKMRGALRKGT